CACSPFAVAFLFFRFPPAPSLFPYTTLFRFPSRSRFLRYIRRFVALHFWHSLIPVRLESGHNRGLCYRNYRRIQRLSNRESKPRSEEHTSELQSRENLVCRLLLEKKKPRYHS